MKSYTIVDRRNDPTRKVSSYVVATDRFLSSWDCMQGGRSLVAYACYNHNEMVKRFNHCMKRSDYQRVRENSNLPRLHGNDRLTIYDGSLD